MVAKSRILLGGTGAGVRCAVGSGSSSTFGVGLGAGFVIARLALYLQPVSTALRLLARTPADSILQQLCSFARSVHCGAVGLAFGRVGLSQEIVERIVPLRIRLVAIRVEDGAEVHRALRGQLRRRCASLAVCWGLWRRRLPAVLRLPGWDSN